MFNALRAARSLQDRVVVITGGARGIGRATAVQLAERGARVCIGDLDPGLTTSVAAEIGRGVHGFALDVTDHAQFSRALGDIEATIGPIDVLINNAGVMPVGAFEAETYEATLREFEINVFAVMHGTREAIRLMRPRGSGHVVTVASMAGVVPTPGAATYSASKHAVVGLYEALVWELRGSGIDLSYVQPVLVNTDLAGGVRRSWAAATIEPDDVAARIVSTLRRPRLAVYAPGWMRPVVAFTAVTPRALMDWIMVRSGSDHLLSDSLGSAERDAYAARIAASAPGAQARHGRSGVKDDSTVR